MARTIFPTLTLDRSQVRWSDFLRDPTPVEKCRGRWYKREDFFAPLGYGGINGSKLRQLIWLVGQYVDSGGRGGILTGASVLSPQLSMAALVARHYGLSTQIVLGGTKPETAIRHDNVAIAAMAGASFEYARVGYNPAIQSLVMKLASGPTFKRHYHLHYGITTPASAANEDVAAFHHVGAAQTVNLPLGIERLILPAGSCNSCVSVLLGLALNRPSSLRRVTLIGIGPTRLEWIVKRLDAIAEATGLDVCSLFRPLFHHHPDAERVLFNPQGKLVLEHFDLHSTGRFKYQDRMKAELDGIVFHPTYEGKCIQFMKETPDEFQGFWAGDGSSLFWIVGSEPDPGLIAAHL